MLRFCLNFQKTIHNVEDDWEEPSNENPEVQEQLDGLSKENKSLAREVAFLKETIKVNSKIKVFEGICVCVIGLVC